MQTVSTNICERMCRSQELSEFQRGTVIGGRLCNKSSCEISSLLNIPQSTVSGFITTATQPWSGRPRKTTEQGQRMLRRIVHRGRDQSIRVNRYSGVVLQELGFVGPLVPVKGTLNASAHQEMLDNSILPTLWKQFGDGPFLFNMTVQQCTKQVHKDMDERVWCGWTWLACTESWPQPDRTPLGWIGAETESQAFPSNISVWSHKCASGRMVKNSHKHS